MGGVKSEIEEGEMVHGIGTPMGICLGVLLFVAIRKNKIVIGRPYSYSDWFTVNSGATALLLFLMILEWSAYSAALSTFGARAETSLLVFLLKKSCFVPLVSLAISYLWGKLAKKRHLFYAEGYSSWTAICCLSAIVATICFNVQWILLPGIDDTILQDFMQDSVVAWSLMVIGTFFGLGAGCAGRNNTASKRKVTLQGYVLPVVSAVSIGLLGFGASALHLAFLVPSCLIATIVAVFICCLVEVIRRPTLRRVMKKIGKANKRGYKFRKMKGEFKGIRFRVEGEWLILERDNLIKYRGGNEVFDDLFGYQKLRVGTRIDKIKSVLINRHERQVEFISLENKRVLDFPEDYCCENERFAKEE